MNPTRLYQYAQRVYYVQLKSLPGNYRQRRVEILSNIFKAAIDFLDQLEVEYWLNFGTLLGWYRENGLIAGDIDIDIGVHEKFYPEIKAAAHLLPMGISMYDTSHKHNGPKLYLSHKGFDGDIYFYKDLDHSFLPLEKNEYFNYQQPVPKNLIYPLSRQPFMGKTVFVPGRTKAYLEFIYGYTGEDAVMDPKTGFWLQKDH